MNYGLATFNQHKFTVQEVSPATGVLQATSSFINITSNATITGLTLCGSNVEGDVVFITGNANAVIAGGGFTHSTFTCAPGRVLCLFRMGASWYEAFRTAQNGDTGNTGNSPSGSTGAQGAQGNPGSQGSQGNAGAQGPQGVQGASGDMGAQGAQGV
jgi:hypothetical protein